MSADVSIVDYGSGNLFGLMRAFETIGATVNLTANAIEISAANRLVPLGVGAFGRAAGALRGKGLFGAIQNFAHSGRPFLGICVGMQLMMDHGTSLATTRAWGLFLEWSTLSLSRAPKVKSRIRCRTLAGRQSNRRRRIGLARCSKVPRLAKKCTFYTRSQQNQMRLPIS